jgi:peroxiredoxin
VVLFGTPGAFTPNCKPLLSEYIIKYNIMDYKINWWGSNEHVPGFMKMADKFKKEKGVGIVACVAVNESYVMDA